MDIDSLMPLFVLGTSLVTGIVIFSLKEEQHRTRTVLNMFGVIAKLILIAVMLLGVYEGHTYATRFPITHGIDFLFRVDALAMLFVALSSVLWLLTTIYAVGYLEGSANRSRFFGFFSLCVASTMGISFAGNLFTFFLFYEMLTIVTYPLVTHRGTEKAMRAGNIYLAYTLTGGVLLLIGIVYLHVLSGPVEFATGGALKGTAAENAASLKIIFYLLIAGLGVKAALVPLHGWLPAAMVAPAPVSALLHAVAVVKAGVFGMVRVIYNIYGIGLAGEIGVMTPLAVIASVTIVYGSIRALTQDDLKRRLAFSTVSQLSYIPLGVAVAGAISTVGGLVHIIHQGIMKITLFLAAGMIAETMGLHRVSEMGGIGKRMPWTAATLTVASFGMIGVPPLAGFISKWYLGVGALDAGQPWVVGVLLISSLLNAAYFLPLVYAVWFKEPARAGWPEKKGVFEASPWLLFPTLATAALLILAGLLAGSDFSPLHWAELIAQREYVK